MVSENLLLAEMFVSVNGGGAFLLCGGKVVAKFPLFGGGGAIGCDVTIKSGVGSDVLRDL